MSREQKKPGVVIRLAKFTLPYLPMILLCVLCVLLVNAAEIVKPYVLKVVIDDFLVGGKAQSGLYSIVGLGIVYLAVIAGGALFSMAQVRLISRIGQSILHSMRMQVFSHIHRMPLKILDKYGSGRLITRATNDIEALNEFYTDVLVNLFKDLFLLIGIMGMMLAMNPMLALIGFVTVPFIVLLTMMLRKKMHENFANMKALISRINGFFAENMAGMRIVQVFNREKNKMDEFRDLNKRYFKTTMTQVLINSVLRPAMEVVNSLAIALLIVYGLGRIEAGVLEIGVLYAFTNYIKQFFEPINDLAEKYNTIQSALVSAERVYELLDDNAEQEDLKAGKHGGPVAGKVEFRDVYSAYEGDDYVLKGISFTVERGGKAAFVGATGAGKTTIISLISRFYIPQKGTILVDDVPIEDWVLGDLRRGVAVVLQDVFLFAGTIRDNIRIHSAMSDEKVAAALALSMADGFVGGLPGGIDHEVTERGSTFSSGERQLLSFARAISHDPAILVLDEATANIDTATEQRIKASIESISQDRTALFIAHRLSTIRHCDQIFVMQDGLIVERGDHDALLNQGGLYAQLIHSQAELA